MFVYVFFTPAYFGGVQKGHVRLQLESNAFSAYLCNDRASLEPKLGFRAHLMEATRTSKWWCKYVIVVEAE